MTVYKKIKTEERLTSTFRLERDTLDKLETEAHNKEHLSICLLIKYYIDMLNGYFRTEDWNSSFN